MSSSNNNNNNNQPESQLHHAGFVERLKRDSPAIYAAIMELLDNALAAGATAISIRFEPRSGGGTDIYIADNGSGMTRDQLTISMKINNPSDDTNTSSMYGMGVWVAAAAFLDENNVRDCITFFTRTNVVSVPDDGSTSTINLHSFVQGNIVTTDSIGMSHAEHYTKQMLELAEINRGEQSNQPYLQNMPDSIEVTHNRNVPNWHRIFKKTKGTIVKISTSIEFTVSNLTDIQVELEWGYKAQPGKNCVPIVIKFGSNHSWFKRSSKYFIENDQETVNAEFEALANDSGSIRSIKVNDERNADHHYYLSNSDQRNQRLENAISGQSVSLIPKTRTSKKKAKFPIS